MPVLAILTSIAVPVIAGFRAVTRWRGRKRNEAGRCAACGASWAERYPDVDQYLVGGQYVCATCGPRMRSRLRRGLVAAALVATFVGTATLISNGLDIWLGHLSFSWWRLLYWIAPVGVFSAVGAAGVLQLRADNRAALKREDNPRRLAAPESRPALQATEFKTPGA